MKLKDLPEEIKKLVLKRINIDNAFEYYKDYDLYGLFAFKSTPESYNFWYEINSGNFKPFYDLYPQENESELLLNEYLNKLLCTKEIKIKKPICSNSIAESVTNFLKYKN